MCNVGVDGWGVEGVGNGLMGGMKGMGVLYK